MSIKSKADRGGHPESAQEHHSHVNSTPARNLGNWPDVAIELDPPTAVVNDDRDTRPTLADPLAGWHALGKNVKDRRPARWKGRR